MIRVRYRNIHRFFYIIFSSFLFLITGCFLNSCSSGRYGGSYLSEDYRKTAFKDSGKTETERDTFQKASKGPRKISKRLIIYLGKLGIKVADVDFSSKNIEKITKALGGFIESSSIKESFKYSTIVVRIPAAKFQIAIKKFSKLGEVYKHVVKAQDVTNEFFDLLSRIKLAEETRKRLYNLLAKVEKIKERIKILEEIERLTEKIDKWTAQKNLISQRANFSTIIISLETRIEQTAKLFIPSPFGWISGLKPKRRSIYSMKNISKQDLKTPKNFLANFKKFTKGFSAYLFLSPDHTRIRAGAVENYPKGNLAFWSKALLRECENRGYKLLKSSNFQKNKKAEKKFLHFQIADGLTIYYYEIYLLVTSKNIYIMEAFYPNDESYNLHKKNVFNNMKLFQMDG